MSYIAPGLPGVESPFYPAPPHRAPDIGTPSEPPRRRSPKNMAAPGGKERGEDSTTEARNTMPRTVSGGGGRALFHSQLARQAEVVKNLAKLGLKGAGGGAFHGEAKLDVDMKLSAEAA